MDLCKEFAKWNPFKKGHLYCVKCGESNRLQRKTPEMGFCYNCNLHFNYVCDKCNTTRLFKGWNTVYWRCYKCFTKNALI